MNISAVTPNWRSDLSPLPTDTLRPPVSSPLEWAYLSASLRSASFATTDAYLHDLSQDETVERVLHNDPSFVVVSTTPNALYWRCPPFSVAAPGALISAFKSAGYAGRIVLVGPHGTHNPEWALKATGADYVWRGSTDVLLGPTLESLDPTDSPHMYSGGATGTIRVDSAAELPTAELEVLGTSPGYAPHAWSLSEEEKNVFGVNSQGILLEASRGCPWACAYCAKGPVRDKYGRRPLASISRELRDAVDLGYDYVFFIDETFNIASDHQDAVLSLLENSGLSFGFQGRPDLITADRARRLASAGCLYAELGVDVVGDLLSKDMGRRQHLDQADAGVDVCREAIPIVRFNRLNMSTLDYIDIYPHDRSLTWDIPVDPIYPYPGSPLGSALMRHYGRSVFDWEFAEQYSWWLRMEVRLQREQPFLPVDTIRDLQRTFLGMDRPAAAALAGLMPPESTTGGIHELNKSLRGVGGELHVRRTGA